MVNVYVIRKLGALLLSPLITTIFFFVGITFWGMIYGLVFLMVGLLISYLVSHILLKNPFNDLLEGKGLLALNLDSTGLIRPFICGVKSPFITGRFNGKSINDVFDRKAVFQFATPKKGEYKFNKKAGIDISLSEEEYNSGRFSFFHFPCIIWNEQIKSVLTKDFLSDQEKLAFAEHQVLYLNRKMEELTTAVRDFGRHVVELTKPMKDIFKSPITWIIIVVLLIVLGFLFAPALINTISKSIGGGGLNLGLDSAKSAVSTIQPN